MFDLHDYQGNLCDLTIEHMLEGGAPCLVSETGSGKTVMFAELAERFRSWGYNVLLLAHRNEIIKQLAASCYEHCGEPIGYYSAKRTTEFRNIMVSMVPTLARRRAVLPSFKGWVVLLDEGHHIQARSYQEIIKEIQPAFFAAATATPITPTGAGLGKFGITRLIRGPQAKWLMEQGRLCWYRMFAGEANVDTKGLSTVGGDYNAKQLEERIVEVDGDFVRDLRKFNPDLKPTISVTISIDHAHQLAEEYKAAGISAEVVIGDTPESQRERAFERFTAGKLQVIVSVALIDEGLDLPAATCLQLIRPTKSLRLWKQLIGRVLRIDKKNPDKVALIIDHGNCWENLPLPHEPIDWTLEGKVKPQLSRLMVDKNNQVVAAPEVPYAAVVAKGNKRQLKELPIEDIYQQRLRTRFKAANKNLFLVNEKKYSPMILWPFASDSSGLSEQQKRAIERALGLPLGYCNTHGAR